MGHRFPTLMKAVNITPVFKKDDRTYDANSRPIGILQKFQENVYVTYYAHFFDKIFSSTQVSRGFQCSTLHYQTNRKIEAIFGGRSSVWCFAN